MATYSYAALDAANAYVKGKIDAGNARTATAQLERNGLLIVNLREERGSGSRWRAILSGSATTQERIAFTRNLHAMLESGIALDQAVRTTAEQSTHPRFRATLHDVVARLQQGQALHAALALHPDHFEPFYISLIKVGEASGRLDEVLAYLLEKQERDFALLSKARGAMVYPSVILIALLIMVTGMLTFVIPRISDVLTQYGVKLPLATRVLLAVSHFTVHYGLYLLPVLLVLAWLARQGTKRGRTKVWWDTALLRIPRIGRLVREFNLARFARSMSSLLRSGIAIDQALNYTSTVTANSRFSQSLRGGIPFVQKGIPMSEVLKGHPQLYPPLATRMVEVGERTGKLDGMLTRLANFYEASVEQSLTNISSIIEPMLLLLIGLTVGFIAIAILTPIWSFSKTLS